MTALIDWLSLRDYRLAKTAATDSITKRQSRGNVSVQNGWYMTRQELLSLSRQADVHMANLRRRVTKR
jgi:hypothetical protein